MRWSPGVLETPKEVSLSCKSTNRFKHSANNSTNKLSHVSKLQVTNAGLKLYNYVKCSDRSNKMAFVLATFKTNCYIVTLANAGSVLNICTVVLTEHKSP